MVDRLGMTAASAEFRIGAVLDQSFAVLRARPAPFLILAAIGSLPAFLLGLMIVGRPDNIAFLIGLSTILSFVLGLIVQGALVYAAFQQMRGENFTIGQTIAQCVKRLLPLIGTSFLTGLVLLIALILLVIPGLIAFTALFVAVCACMVERLGPVASLQRSASLTKYHRWKVFGIILLVWIVGAVVSQIVKMVFIAASAPIIAAFATYIIQIALTAFFSIVATVIYYHLRVVKEGLTIDSIARVFD